MTKAEIKNQLNSLVDSFEPTINENDTLSNSQLAALCDSLAGELSEINNPNSTHYPPTPVQ